MCSAAVVTGQRKLDESELVAIREEFYEHPGPAVPAELVDELLSRRLPLLSGEDRREVLQQLLDDLEGLGGVSELLRDPTVTDVLINGPGVVWIERNGELQQSHVWLGEQEVKALIERSVGASGRRVDRAQPIADAWWIDGSRVCVVLGPIARHGPCVSIRKLAASSLPLSAFCEPQTCVLLKQLVEQRKNLLVFGSTGSGKTTLLNALLQCCPASERIVTIEDTAELRLPGRHWVALDAREDNSEGIGAIDLSDLVRTSLRMRPDRMVIGEVRGAECLDLLWALSTGHSGSMSSCHASDVRGALARLETYTLLANSGLPLSAIRRQIVAAIDVFVGVERGWRGARRVSSITRVGLSTDGEYLLSSWSPNVVPVPLDDQPSVAEV